MDFAGDALALALGPRNRRQTIQRMAADRGVSSRRLAREIVGDPDRYDDPELVNAKLTLLKES